ncbi:MAG: signal peptidase I [Deltaproteobacteria bacterium]|nr:signal peptidase I [Deltaproteobacteria bacterium]
MSSNESSARVWVEAILIAVIFLKFANTYVVQTFFIPSGSMEDTLLVGDHLFVNRFIFGATASEAETSLLPQRPVQRGDILVFRSVEEPGVDVVKRCVGLPGDEVEVSGKHLFLNGKRVRDGDFAVHKEPNIIPRMPNSATPGAQRDYFGPLTVPEGHVFCLGDNRDRSKDSRYWGPLPVEHIKGRALLIYWSYAGETPDGEWRGYGSKLKQIAQTLIGIPTKSRWNRTFQLIR